MSTTKKIEQKEIKISPDIHVDENFLQDHLKDVRSEMSWRRELEFRLLQFLLVFYPIIGGAIVALFQSPVIDKHVFYITASGASLLILVATIFVTDRINREHRSYAELGYQVQKIWAYFGLFEPGAYIGNDTVVPTRLYNQEKGYGQGQGHKKTLGLIWLTAIALLLVLFTLALLKN
jgi:hypothetical protein